MVNWASLVRNLLFDMGMGHVWFLQSVGDETGFVLAGRQVLSDQFLQSWQADMRDGTARTDQLFHPVLQYSSYLSNVNVSKFRTALTRFRCSNHKLAIEAGRWHKPRPISRTERRCILCDLAEIEDEYHFVIVCSFYKEIRQKFIPGYYVRHPSMFKFVQLMAETRQSVQRKLAMFIFYAMELRDSAMY